jgi:hypothetical protein
MNSPGNVDPRSIQPGPVRNKSLSPELLEQIKAVFGVVGPYLNMTLEEFEIGFMRDAHPESEVAVWHGISSAWSAYRDQFLGAATPPAEEVRLLLGALLAISTGVTNPADLDVPEEVGKKLIQCYIDGTT